MRCSICMVIIPVFLSGLAYRYVQFIPGAKEPFNQMSTLAVFRIADDIISFISCFGYSKIDLITRFHELIPKPKVDDRVETSDEVFDGVQVRIYRPKALRDKILPGLMFFHGGGWKFGSIKLYDALTRNISLQSNIVVVSVEYKLMPKYRYPVQLNECLKATKYFLRNAEKFKVDSSKIGVAGDSAGGNLAAAVTLKLTNDENPTVPTVKSQVLIYPFLQAFDFKLPSHREFSGKASTCHITREVIADTALMYGFNNQGSLEDICKNRHVSVSTRKQYERLISPSFLGTNMQNRGGLMPPYEEPNETLSTLVNDNLIDPYAWPLMSSDDLLRKLPTTYMVVMELDSLRDDGLIFAERLRRLGVNIKLQYWEGLEHDLFNLFHYNSYSLVMDALADFLRRSL